MDEQALRLPYLANGQFKISVAKSTARYAATARPASVLRAES